MLVGQAAMHNGSKRILKRHIVNRRALAEHQHKQKRMDANQGSWNDEAQWGNLGMDRVTDWLGWRQSFIQGASLKTLTRSLPHHRHNSGLDPFHITDFSLPQTCF
jgi:hypothetical protein